jgi:hypothetical protein
MAQGYIPAALAEEARASESGSALFEIEILGVRRYPGRPTRQAADRLCRA